MVVVQLFTANHDAPWRNVGAGVWRFKIAITPIVANAINDARGGDGNPRHLHGPDCQTRSPKKSEVDDHHQTDTLPAESGIQIALKPVVRRAVAKLDHGLLVLAFSAVQLGALPEHGFDAIGLRAMGVFRSLTLGVVFAVNRHPLFSHLTGTKPQPESEKMRWNRVQIHGSVGLVAMQVNGHAGDGDVSRHQRIQHDLPPAGSQ